ncbi:MAG: ATP-binding cassette domain-containing protein [Rhodospirillales bacterium]|nr:ATP-binding cassette domain-containing protein [Rhodospirillales bacterium]
MIEEEVILKAEGLTKEFKGFIAVKNVDLSVRRHTIHALIGPNGAGKTTCFNLLTHFLTPTAGQIHFKGRNITGSSPAAIARMGLARSFQISAVFPHLSVRENVRVALQRKLGNSFHFWRSERVLNQLDSRAVELVTAVGLAAFAEQQAVDLPYGRKRALELLLTGEPVDAETALAWGLVNRVTPAADLTDEALALARDICAGAPLAAAAVKEITRATAAMSLEQGYATLRGGGLPVYQAMLTSADAAEGPRAFAERRSPRWTGR